MGVTITKTSKSTNMVAEECKFDLTSGVPYELYVCSV